MHSRIAPALPSTLVLAAPPPPGRRRVRARDWLFWTLAISLLIHLLVLVALIWQRTAPSEDQARAEAPAEWQIQLEPSKDTAAPPPSTPSANQPPIQAAPTVDRPSTQPPKPQSAAPPPQAAPQVTKPAEIAPPPVLTSPKANETVAAPAKPRPPETKPIPRPVQPASPSPFANMQQSNDFFTPQAAPPPPAQTPPREARRGGVNLSLGKVERFDQAPAARHQNDLDADIQISGAEVGQDWLKQLHGWWIDHRRYPSEAVANNEEGDVVIRFDVAKSGLTSHTELLQSSRSQWLDAAAMSTFNHAHLPPLPPTTPEDHATITITIRYLLY